MLIVVKFRRGGTDFFMIEITAVSFSVCRFTPHEEGTPKFVAQIIAACTICTDCFWLFRRIFCILNCLLDRGRVIIPFWSGKSGAFFYDFGKLLNLVKCEMCDPGNLLER